MLHLQNVNVPDNKNNSNAGTVASGAAILEMLILNFLVFFFSSNFIFAVAMAPNTTHAAPSKNVLLYPIYLYNVNPIVGPTA